LTGWNRSGAEPVNHPMTRISLANAETLSEPLHVKALKKYFFIKKNRNAIMQLKYFNEKEHILKIHKELY